MNKNTKGFVNIIVIIAVLVVIAGGVYFVTKKSSVGNDIADWKTYHSEKYGFEFKYPASWGEPTESQVSTRTNIDFVNKLFISTGIYYNQVLGRALTLEESSRIYDGTGLNAITWDKEPIVVGGRPGIRVSSGPNEAGSVAIFVTAPDNTILTVEFNIDENDVKGSQDLYNKILSTVKFI